jgi:hypothetical protein
MIPIKCSERENIIGSRGREGEEERVGSDEDEGGAVLGRILRRKAR